MIQPMVLLNQEDDGPESRLIVTYRHGANRCVLPCRMIGYQPSGDLLVEVEHQDPRRGHVFRRDQRRIKAEDLVLVEHVS